MKKNVIRYGCVAALSVGLAACSATPQNPTAPTGAIGGATAAGANGESLKVSAPAIIEPAEGRTSVSRRPTLVWANAAGKYESVGVAYELEVSNSSAVVYTQTVGETPNTGSHEVGIDLPYDTVHFWRARAVLGTTQGQWSGYAEFRTPKNVVATVPTTPTTPTGTGSRTPDPPSGRIPRPNHLGQVSAFNAANPGFLRNSCQLEGGTWQFMDGVVDMLRGIDMRYGYNCKRGNCNDPSLDVISYHYGTGPDEGSSQVYCTDLISGHCGSNPGLIWNDVTDVTLNSGTVCRVTAVRPGRSSYPFPKS